LNIIRRWYRERSWSFPSSFDHLAGTSNVATSTSTVGGRTDQGRRMCSSPGRR